MRKTKSMSAARDPRFRFYLALAYLVWTLLPHFGLVFHSHAGGSHAHASFSAGEIRMANRVLDGLGPAGLPEGDSETGGHAGNGIAGSAAGEAALAKGGANPMHGHFWEDANLAGAASLPVLGLPVPVLLAFAPVRYLPPGLRPSGAAPARGPPSFSFA